MPERIVAPNSGVPMSNSNGGTQETGGDQTQGGGAANPGVGSVGTSGTSNAPSSSSASNDLMLAELTSAITAYLAVGAILPGDDFIMDLYMDNKLGFKTIEKDLEEANPEVDKKTIKDLVKAEKEKTKAFLQGPGKAAFKDKLDQLKIEIKDMQSTMGSVAQEVTMSITDAFMPPVVGPVAPNPLSSVLKISLKIIAIKTKIDIVLAGVLVVLKLMDELGLGEHRAVTDIVQLAAPIVRVQQSLKDAFAKAEKEAKDSDDGYKTEHPEAGGGNIEEGATITGQEIQIEAQSRYSVNGEWPLKKKNRKAVKKLVNSSDEIEAEWGELFQSYNEWLKVPQPQIVSSGNRAFAAGSYNPDNVGQIGGRPGS